MTSWYKLAQESNLQMDLSFYPEIEVKPPTIPKEILIAPKTIEMLSETIEDCVGYDAVIKALNENGFTWENITLPDSQLITVILNGNVYVLNSFDYPEPKDGKEWIDGLCEHELYSYLPPDEDESFWDNIGAGYSVYHATTEDKLESILKEGLTPMNETRGINNKWTPAAVFASENSDDIDSYGDVVLEVNLAKMKTDGYMPTVSRETPVEEAQDKSKLAHKIGLIDYEPSEDYYSSDGIRDTTVVIYGTIPPQYLSVI